MVRTDAKDNDDGTQIPLSSYLREVNYSCGSCGYHLNLSSNNRKASFLGSKYGKSIKSGIIRFFSIDESRFRQVEQFQWTIPFQFQWTSVFSFKRSRDLSKRKNKLLCRRCGKHIGTAYSMPSSSGDEASHTKVYNIKLKSLLPSPYDDIII